MKHSKTFRILSAVIAAVLLASCSAVRTMEWQKTTRHELLDANAGKPVSNITYISVRPGGGTTISANQLVTWTDFNQAHAYLVTVGEGCPNLYLYGAHITSTRDEVRAHSDHVISAGFRCEVQTIQPVDWQKVERRLERMRQARQHATPGDRG